MEEYWNIICRVIIPSNFSTYPRTFRSPIESFVWLQKSEFIDSQIRLYEVNIRLNCEFYAFTWHANTENAWKQTLCGRLILFSSYFSNPDSLSIDAFHLCVTSVCAERFMKMEIYSEDSPFNNHIYILRRGKWFHIRVKNSILKLHSWML